MIPQISPSSQYHGHILTLLENITNALCIFDAEWNIVYINKNAQQFSNRPIKELLHKNLHKEFPAFKKTIFFKNYKKAMSTQKPIKFEAYHERLKKWLSVHAYPSKEGLLVYYSDITKRKKIENDLQFQSNILEHVLNSITVTDKKGNIIYWNQGAEKLFGYTEKEIKGKSVRILYPFLTKKQLQIHLKELHQQQEMIGEWKARKKDGSQIWVEFKRSCFLDENGKFIGYLGVANDITEKKRVQGNLKFLSQASKVLASSLDFRKTLDTVSDLAVSHMAEWCVIDLLNNSGGVDLVSIVHKDEKKIQWARDLRKKYPPDLKQDSGIGKVIKTSKPEFYPVITEEMLKTSAKSKKQLALYKQLDISSAMILPITVHHKAIGTCSFIYTNKRHYDNYDFQTAEKLVSRASLAIENLQLYETVEKERERLNNLIANVPGVVWEAYGKPDESLQLINYVSEYAEKMLGYSLEEWLGTPNFWLKIVHTEDRERAAREAAQIYESGKGGISRFRWVTKKGEARWVEAHSIIIKDRQKKPIGMRGVTMDVHDRMIIEQKKDEFISIASHELKTPLTSIKGYLQLLERVMQKKENAKAFRLVEKSNLYVDRLNNLITDLLDVSKIQSGKIQFNFSDFDTYDLIKEIADSFQTNSENHSIIIEHNTHRKITGDRERLEQVIMNLLTNAIKYSPKANKVVITASDQKDTIKISVRDYGIGIPKQYQKDLFKRFYRVETSEKQFSGLGIGLYISAQIIVRHGGKIGVKSNEGKGSEFYFTIPVKPPLQNHASL